MFGTRQGLNHAHVARTEIMKIDEKKSKDLGHQNELIRFADASRPPEVTRRDGFR